MLNYTTISQVKRYLKLSGDLDIESVEENLLQEMIIWATGFINWYKARRYDPFRTSYSFDVPLKGGYYITDFINSYYSPNVSSSLMLDGEYLSEVFSITNGDGVEISSSDYVLQPARKQPKTWIDLIGDIEWSGDDNGNISQVISIDAIWGAFDPAMGWVETMDVLQTSVSESDTTLTVSNINGSNALLLTPRIEIGMGLKIDDEIVFVTSVDEEHNTAIVSRGFNGTTAEAHDAGKELYSFKPLYQIEQACVRLVAWRYRQKDADNFDKIYNMGDQSISIPTGIPSDVMKILGAQGQARIL